jgi:hypothetical protein
MKAQQSQCRAQSLITSVVLQVFSHNQPHALGLLDETELLVEPNLVVACLQVHVLAGHGCESLGNSGRGNEALVADL